MTDQPINPTEHHYNLLAAMHDRIEDIDVYRKYLEQAEQEKHSAWAEIWRRMISDAEQSIEFIQAEVERRASA